MNDNLALIHSVGVLALKPGDSLLVRCDSALSSDMRQRLQAYIRAELGPMFTAPMLIIDRGMTVEIVRQVAA
jgi:hypothetical protein